MENYEIIQIRLILKNTYKIQLTQIEWNFLIT